MSPKRCPRCDILCSQRDSFCPVCGRALVEEEEAEPGQTGRWLLGPLIWFLELFPGLAHPGVIIMAAIVVALAVPVGYMALVFAQFGVLASYFMAGFALLMYGTGVAWLMCGYLCFPAEGLAEFDSMKWMVYGVLILAPVTALMAFVHYSGGG